MSFYGNQVNWIPATYNPNNETINLLGKKVILNNKNNKAYGEYSTALGVNNVSGTKCFTITELVQGEYGYVKLKLNSIEGLIDNQECRFKINSEYFSKITSIDKDTNYITVDFKFTELNQTLDIAIYQANTSKGEYPDENNPYLIRMSDGTDTEKNSLFIVGEPEIGTDRVLGSTSVAFGSNNQASVFNTIVAGGDNFALGGYSAVFGYENKGAYGSIVAGRNNDARLSEYSAVFGNKNTSTAKSNFSCMFGNRNIVGAEHGVAIGYSNQSLAKGAMAFGFENTVTGIYSIALGFKHKIDGMESLAVGSQNTIDTNGGKSLVAGSGNTVSAPHSAAFGMNNVIATSTKNGRSIASGSENVINHNYCATFGKQLETGRDSQIIVGRQNVVDSNAVFIVANGTASTGTSNAFIVKSDGSAEVQTMGETVNSVATRGYVENKVVSQSNVSQVYDSTSSQAMSGVAVNQALTNFNSVESGVTEQGIIWNKINNHVICVCEGITLYSSSSEDYSDKRIKVYYPADATGVSNMYGFIKTVLTPSFEGEDNQYIYYHNFTISSDGGLIIYKDDTLQQQYTGGSVGVYSSAINKLYLSYDIIPQRSK